MYPVSLFDESDFVLAQSPTNPSPDPLTGTTLSGQSGRDSDGADLHASAIIKRIVYKIYP